MSHIYHRALFIKKTLGTRRAAGFLRNKGISLEQAVKVLANQAKTDLNAV